MYFIVVFRPKHICTQIHIHNYEDWLLTKGISFPNIIKAGKWSFILSLWSWKGKHWKQVFPFLGKKNIEDGSHHLSCVLQISIKIILKNNYCKMSQPIPVWVFTQTWLCLWPKRKSGLIQFRIIKITHKKSTLPNVHNVSNSTTSYCPLDVYVNYSIDFHWWSRKEHLMGRKDRILRSFSSS